MVTAESLQKQNVEQIGESRRRTFRLQICENESPCISNLILSEFPVRQTRVLASGSGEAHVLFIQVPVMALKLPEAELAGHHTQDSTV
ncbi:hypothetical protein NPIL_16411 [Nephila pilipes]|uniref:Uncharacterized protein n=1 Tax=Nephila pilipes TaxID=299642 RepID=A0A8X6N4B3_NEPPI|nr:hypothetical protein NPIL_16411 [Nephila pilipes]